VLEIGWSLPLFILLLKKYDIIAIVATYEMLATAVICQIPKRFCWRLRPFAEGRAEGIGVVLEREDTSSLPSRFVVGATVFGCLFALVAEGDVRDSQVNWGPSEFKHWIAITLLILVVSCSRIVLGYHYPSCCICGVAIGFCCHYVGLGLAKIHISCNKVNEDREPRERPFAAGIVISVGVLLGVLFVSISVLEPLAFWKKSTQAFGLLLPPLIFIFAFLCPSLSGHNSISEVEDNAGEAPSQATVIAAVGITLTLSTGAWATQRKHILTSSSPVNFSEWLSLFELLCVLSLLALLGTRIVQREQERHRESKY